VRLRPLTEAECYARCYGGWPVDSVKVLRADVDQGGPGAAREGLDGRVETAEELEAA
jgi:hypothetical protein